MRGPIAGGYRMVAARLSGICCSHARGVAAGAKAATPPSRQTETPWRPLKRKHDPRDGQTPCVVVDASKKERCICPSTFLISSQTQNPVQIRYREGRALSIGHLVFAKKLKDRGRVVNEKDTVTHNARGHSALRVCLSCTVARPHPRHARGRGGESAGDDS